jgi:hypothetical protein
VRGGEDGNRNLALNLEEGMRRKTLPAIIGGKGKAGKAVEDWRYGVTLVFLRSSASS